MLRDHPSPAGGRGGLLHHTVVPTALAAAVALTGCSGGEADSSASPPTPSTSRASATPTSPAASTPLPPVTTAAPKPPAKPKPKPTVDRRALLRVGCVRSANVISVAVTKWNKAVASGNKSLLRAATVTLRGTAAFVRKEIKAAGDATFTKAAGRVARDLDSIASRYTAGKSVDGRILNTNQRSMIAYCQSRL